MRKKSYKADRDGIVGAYAFGRSLRETAEEFGVSHERVRQILKEDAPNLIRAPHLAHKNKDDG